MPIKFTLQVTNEFIIRCTCTVFLIHMSHKFPRNGKHTKVALLLVGKNAFLLKEGCLFNLLQTIRCNNSKQNQYKSSVAYIVNILTTESSTITTCALAQENSSLLCVVIYCFLDHYKPAISY